MMVSDHLPDWVRAFDNLNRERATVDDYETYMAEMVSQRLDGKRKDMTWEQNWAAEKLASSLSQQAGSSPQPPDPSAARSDPRRCKP